MAVGFALIALVFCAAGSTLLLLLTFVLLPWARRRMGRWALALIPASTFVGTYAGWLITIRLFTGELL